MDLRFGILLKREFGEHDFWDLEAVFSILDY